MKKGLLVTLSTLTGAAIGAGLTKKTTSKQAREANKFAKKHLALYLMMNEWVHVKQDGKSIAKYFEKHNYRKIAVYGMNYVGETLLRELEGSEIEVMYAIDKNADDIYVDVDVVKPDAELAEVDAIVVTPITFFEEIEEMLSERMDCPIISLEDILYEV